MNRGEPDPNQPVGLPRVVTGSIAVLRLYDLAYSIDLAAVEELIRGQRGARAARLRLRRAEPKAMAFGEPPLEVVLGPLTVRVLGEDRSCEAIARIHEFGVVTIALRLPANDLSWQHYTALVAGVDGVLGAEAAAVVWTDQLERVRALIAPAIGRPSPSGLEEDYLIATVQQFDRTVTGAEALERLDLPRLLSGDPRPLAPAARTELLRHAFMYYEDDLAVITWDHAFVLEPGGDSDVADVLEVANAQLLELRYYDAVLDAELPRMYERVRQTHQTFHALARRPHARLARQLYTRVAEVTELMERVDNAIVVTEDIYLARIYGAALELFRVRSWAAAVDRKLEIMRDTYGSLYDEASSIRAELLEAAIVLLIVLDIVLAFVL
jgi:hypothetical protein